MKTQSIAKIRDAALADRPIVNEIFKASYAEYAENSDPKFWGMYQTNTSNTLLTDNNVTRIIVDLDGVTIGSVLLCPPNRKLGNSLFTNPYPEMRLLGILPQNRNTGAASLLINECENRARADGFDAITLHTTVLMQKAKAMYERRGYVRFPELDFEPVPGFIVWGFIKRLDTRSQ
jgi:ribosomal protein S18 acetylase RimI-like enzyme